MQFALGYCAHHPYNTPMQELNLIQQVIIAAPPILLAITLHEVAHGRVALRLGDPTARDLGRLSLNPLRHVDPVGTVLVPLLMLLSSKLLLGTGLLFGWAKPVPVDFRRLRNPRRDMAFVALAGPMSNIVMAICWASIFKWFAPAIDSGGGWLATPMIYMAGVGITINIILAVLNLLPIPPLDGGRVAVAVLPRALAVPLARSERYGLLIIIAMFATGILGKILMPAMEFVQRIIFWIV